MTSALIIVSPSLERNQFLVNMRHVSAQEQVDRRYGGALVLGTINSPTEINPITTTHSVSASLIKIIFNRLIRMNEKGELEPDLADRWTISSDGLRFVFYLRKGILFHDGVELTAKDVVFTFNQILDQRNSSPYRIHFIDLKKIEALDTYSVEFQLTQPFPLLVYKLAQMEIVPEHAFTRSGIRSSIFNDHPIGTGAFQFKSWNKTTNELRLVANRTYFEGRPFLDEIKVKVYPTMSALWAAFMRQEIDLIKYLSREDFEVIQKDENFRAYKIPMETGYVLHYNWNDPLIRSRNVRLAIAYAINIEQLISTVGDGAANQGPLYILNLSDEKSMVKGLGYDPVRSISLLREDGWNDDNGDGVLDKNGQSLELIILVDSQRGVDQKIVKYLRQNLAEIGVRLNVKRFERLKNKQVDFDNGQGQILLDMINISNNELHNYETAMYWYSNGGILGEDYRYKNEDYDNIFERLRIEIDVNQRREMFSDLNKIINDDQPGFFLFYPVNYFAVTRRMANTDAYFTPSMPSYTFKDWYIHN